MYITVMHRAVEYNTLDLTFKRRCNIKRRGFTETRQDRDDEELHAGLLDAADTVCGTAREAL